MCRALKPKLQIGNDMQSCGGVQTQALGFSRGVIDELALHRIWAWCITENVASAHVLEKIGMRQEGHLREHEWMKGRWWDTLLYAMLEHEWHDHDKTKMS